MTEKFKAAAAPMDDDIHQYPVTKDEAYSPEEVNSKETSGPRIYEFEKENKTQSISLIDLSNSIRRETGISGIRAIKDYDNNHIQFWTLYNQIIALLQASQVNYTEGEICVQNNSSKAYLTDQERAAGFDHKRAPIDRWRHDKVLTLFQLPNMLSGTDNESRNACIGVTLNKEGIMVAFGMNMHVCSNFNVLGGTILRSYNYNGHESMPWEVMKVKLQQWMSSLTQLWQIENTMMENMKSIPIPEGSGIIENVLGDLYMKAIRQAYFKGELTPFDTNELSNFTQEMIRARRTEDRLATVWDIYNWGTSIMKPGIVDIGEIANNSNLWSNYLINRFEMSVPEAVIVE